MQIKYKISMMDYIDYPNIASYHGLCDDGYIILEEDEIRIEYDNKTLLLRSILECKTISKRMTTWIKIEFLFQKTNRKLYITSFIFSGFLGLIIHETEQIFIKIKKKQKSLSRKENEFIRKRY